MTSFFGIPPITLASWMVAGVAGILLVLLLFAAVNRILLRMALRNIPRRRAQTVLILFGLMLATLIITASLAVGDTLGYSLQAIQLQQIGGIDEAFTRISDRSVQGASTSDAAFFSDAQTADVIARATADPNIVAASGAIVAPGSMIDTTTQQTSSQNVVVFGVEPDFNRVWGPLHSSAGASLNAANLASGDVWIGKLLGDHLNAKSGDVIHLFVDGHPVDVTVKQVLDTEVNPSIAGHGPTVNSVLMPASFMRTVMQRATGYNVIFLHNSGSGGFDDLGPNGSTGNEITRRMRAAVTDQQAATEFKDYLNTPAIKAQIKVIHNQASFLDPTQDLSRRLLVELDQPGMTDEFKSLVGNPQVNRLIFDAVSATVPKSASPDVTQAATDGLVQRTYSLQVNSAAASELKAFLADPKISGPLALIAASLPSGDTTRTALTDLLAEVQSPTLSPKFKSTVGNPEFQKELALTIGQFAPTRAAHFNNISGRLNLYVFNAYKADAVTFSQVTSLVATGALLGVSFFSIAVGVLLIFLIFVMLAAERRAEMGMSRAVGLKRRHLTQMFLFEGTTYTLAASVIGVAAGVLVGMLMIGVLSNLFSGFYPGITFQYHVEWTSLVIAFCLGILLTFIVVAFSAYKVSRLNIVAAIRDLDESESRDEGMLRMFTAVFRVAWSGVKQLVHGHPLVFLSRVTLGTVGAIRTFWWALFRRGPMTVALGVALAVLGVNAQIEIVYSAGVSLIIIGLGLLLKWILGLARVRILVAGRIGFTVASLGLLVYWGRPFGRVEKLLHIDRLVQLDKLNGGPDVFALTALMILLGAIWLVMYNSDLLIRGVMFFAGRLASLAPITRTSMAYPMATKFRTGMAVAMFAIVTFMIVYMSVFQDVLLQNFGNVDYASGGWQIVAGSPDGGFQQTPQTVFPGDVAALVRSDSTVSNEVRGVGWEDQSFGVQLHQVMPNGTVKANQQVNGSDFMGLHVVDNGYLATNTYITQPRAAGYASDRAVWDAVRDNPGFAVIDAAALDAAGGSSPLITGIKTSDTYFQPFQAQVVAGNARKGATATWTVTVVGFMKGTNGVSPVWNGMYISTRTALQGGLYAAPASAPPTSSAPAPSSLGTSLRTLGPTGYYFSLKPGTDVNKARLDLGRMLVRDQLEPVVVADQLGKAINSFLTLLKLMTGFLALGLIVGIAGLGVISTRAVVERWQQIGMLRALGYRRSLVQRSFLMESSLIALLGLVIGALVGVWQSYTFFVTNKTFGTVIFHIPVGEILLILASAYLATLITTYLPSRAASRVAPAEALRYE